MLVIQFVKLKNLIDTIIFKCISSLFITKKYKISLLKKLRVDLRYQVGKYRNSQEEINLNLLHNYCGMEVAYKIINNRYDIDFIKKNSAALYSSIEWESHGNHKLICLIAASLCEFVEQNNLGYVELLKEQVNDLFDDEGVFKEPSLGYGYVCFSGLWIFQDYSHMKVLKPEIIEVYTLLLPFLKTNAFGDFDFGYFSGAGPAEISLPTLRNNLIHKQFKVGISYIKNFEYSILAFNRSYEYFINNKHGHNDALSFVLLYKNKPIVFEKPILSYMLLRNSSRCIKAHNAANEVTYSRKEKKALTQRFENTYQTLEHSSKICIGKSESNLFMSQRTEFGTEVNRLISISKKGVVITDETNSDELFKINLYTAPSCNIKSENLNKSYTSKLYSNYSGEDMDVKKNIFTFKRVNRILIK